MFNIVRNIFAIIGVIMTILIISVLIATPTPDNSELPRTEIQFDVFVPNRTDTLHRSLTTTKGECYIERYDRWTYALRSKESGRIIWKESYPIKIVSQKKIEK